MTVSSSKSDIVVILIARIFGWLHFFIGWRRRLSRWWRRRGMWWRWRGMWWRWRRWRITDSKVSISSSRYTCHAHISLHIYQDNSPPNAILWQFKEICRKGKLNIYMYTMIHIYIYIKEFTNAEGHWEQMTIGADCKDTMQSHRSHAQLTYFSKTLIVTANTVGRRPL